LIAATALVFCSAQAAEGRPEVSRHALAAPPAAEQSIAGLAAYLAPSSFSPPTGPGRFSSGSAIALL